MKKFLFLFFLAGISFFAHTQNKYSEKSGKIVYQYEIGSEQTNFTLIFDDYGSKQIMDITNKVDGVNEHVRTILKSNEMLVVNYADKQVIKMPVAQEDNAGMAEGMDQGVDVEALVKMATENGGSKIGTETLMGKECVIYEVTSNGQKGKYWIYKNFLVKAEFVIQGVHTYMEAKEFSFGVIIPASEFEAPAGFTVTDMSQMQQMMQMYGAPE